MKQIIRIKKLNINQLLCVLLGMTSTMPIVGIHIGARDISFYRIIFSFFLLYGGIYVIKNRVRLSVNSLRLLAWMAWGIFSCFVGWFFLSFDEPAFSSAAMSFLPKVSLLFLFATVWCMFVSNEHRDLCMATARGFLYGCIANCVWAVLDAACFYVLKLSLNNTVFWGYIKRNNIRYDMLSLIINNGKMIRASGFNYDPAHIGYIAPVVAGYAVRRKKYWLLAISLLAVIASASTTAFVASALMIILNLKLKPNTGKIKATWLVIGFLLAFGAVAILSTGVAHNAFGYLSTAVSSFAERISGVYLTGGKDLRLNYILYLPVALINVFGFIITGSGYGTASLGYVRNSSFLKLTGLQTLLPYDMENTYIALLFDTGIVGLLLYLIVIVSIFKYYRKQLDNKENVVIWCAILAQTIVMMFYHYILFAPQILMMTVAVSNIETKRRGIENDVNPVVINE